jgi:plastocyanin
MGTVRTQKSRRALLALLYAALAVESFSGLSFAEESSQGSTESPVVAELGPDGVQRLTLTLDSYSYAPNRIAVLAGKPVELVLKSVTVLTPHNFVLKEGGFSIDQDVRAGETKTVRFVPVKEGQFTFYCDKQLLFFKSHREKGMEGRLDVRP